MSEQRSIELVKTIAAPVKQIYAAFASSVAFQSWFSDFAEIDFREDGRLYFWWDAGYYASGLFTKVVENDLLAFSWSGPDEPHGTMVEISFSKKDDFTQAYAPEVDLTNIETVEVIIRHSGIGVGSEWTERLSAYQQGWETALLNLKSVMETGLDKRLYDRPMLGIMPSDLIDPEKAANLGLDLAYGIILAGTVEGMGAEAAGLQKDDVIVSINHYDLKDYSDFTPALGKCKAGDEVEVIYYRAGVKKTVQMTLSRRQLPEIPKTAADLAEQLGKSYAEVANERNLIFKGVTDEDASVRPADNAWSAKETLVHLLYTERWLHLAISCAVDGQRMGGFVNQNELIAAISETYPLQELLAELDRSEQVTIACLAALPADFVADKRKYFRLIQGIGQGFAQHTQSHFDQIKTALGTEK